MRINVPINSTEEAAKLAEAGADEFYCGVLTKEWKNKYTNIFSINKRHLSNDNLKTYDELKKAFEIAQSHKVQLNFALNHFYTKNQIKDLLEELETAINIGIDNFIVGDLFLLNKLKDRGLSLHLSTVTPIFNNESIDFFKEFNVKRIILPRQLTIKEISYLKKIQLEAIILHGRCPNIDGICSFLHGLSDYLNLSEYACCLDYQFSIDPYSSGDRLQQAILKRKLASRFKKHSFGDACALCFLPELKKAGVSVLKIVGRGSKTEEKLKDINFVKTCLNNLSKKEYPDFVQEHFQKTYNKNCRRVCYYG